MNQTEFTQERPSRQTVQEEYLRPEEALSCRLGQGACLFEISSELANLLFLVDRDYPFRVGMNFSSSLVSFTADRDGLL